MRLISRSLLLLFVVMLLYVGQRVSVMKLGYEIGDLKTEKKNLEQIHNSLLIERSALASVERVEKIATSYLGMKRPGNSQIVFVKQEKDKDIEPAFARVSVSDNHTKSPVRVVKHIDWRL